MVQAEHWVQQARQARQEQALIIQPKIRIIITRTGIYNTGFILILFTPLDQKHITQVIHTQVTEVGTTPTITTMALITMPHPICRTVPTQTGMLMPLLMF
jgi:hypothetical protein